jgi:hypothetical protein
METKEYEIFNTWGVVMFMACVHTKLPIPSSNGSFVIANKSEAKNFSHAHVIMLNSTEYLKNRYTFSRPTTTYDLRDDNVAHAS